jgi:hypothetical protein
MRPPQHGQGCEEVGGSLGPAASASALWSCGTPMSSRAYGWDADSLPLPAPSKQAHHAKAGGEERQGGRERCGGDGRGGDLDIAHLR